MSRHPRFLSRLVGGALLAIGVSACAPDVPSPAAGSDEARGAYRFFVAGHAYGSPEPPHELGLHPPFAARLGWLAAQPEMAWGVLTGDVVYRPTIERWDAVDAQLELLDFPVHIAPGNHDFFPEKPPGEEGASILTREEWTARYGPTWHAFSHQRDRFVILDPGLDHWNITGEQLAFLDAELARRDQFRNLFLFCHQVIWAKQEDATRTALPNSLSGFTGEVNFTAEIEPRLVALERPVFLFSGDVGAHAASPAVWYCHEGNVHYIASGMGHGEEDNLVVVEVDAAGAVAFRLVALNGDDPDALGALEDHPRRDR